MAVCTFDSMAALSVHTLDVLKALKFTSPTPVQEAVIPVFCGNKDVAVDACTGSGKTLAFVIPVAEKLRRLDEPLSKHQVSFEPGTLNKRNQFNLQDNIVKDSICYDDRLEL